MVQRGPLVSNRKTPVSMYCFVEAYSNLLPPESSQDCLGSVSSKSAQVSLSLLT